MQALAGPVRRFERDILATELRLEQDIADKQRQLAELRAMRANIQPFIARYAAPTRAGEDAGQPEETRPTSITDVVLNVFEEHRGQVLDVDDIHLFARENGSGASRSAVRNAINYVVRLGKVDKDEHRRGHYILRDTSTPAGTGVEVTEESANGSLREIGGGRDEPSTPPHDQGDGANLAPDPLDRVGVRAPIGG